MSLATELTRLRKPPTRLDVDATTTLDEVAGKGHVIVASALAVRASAAGLTDEELQEAARAADDGCTFSKLIRASADVTVNARLEGE